MTIYKISEFSKSEGIGNTIKYCNSKENVISFLTNNGRSHHKLMNEFGDGEVEIYDTCILKLVPDNFNDIFGLLKAEPSFVIVHEIDLYTGEK